MPLLPASLIEPLWVEFAALIGTDQRPKYHPNHPLGCHRRRIDDRTVFECVIAALVHGSGYERIAVAGCSDRTIRRRLSDWAEQGVTKDLLRTTLAGYDRMLGLDLEDLSVDGSITNPLVAVRFPADPRSTVPSRARNDRWSPTAPGSPCMIAAAAAANANDSPLLEPTLAGVPDAVGPLPDGACVHLDAGYDSGKTRDLLHILGYEHRIASKGTPSPIQVGKRWVVERTHSWMNGYGKLRRSTDKRRVIVEFFLFLAAALTVIRRLINTARTRYRWEARPSTPRLR